MHTIPAFDASSAIAFLAASPGGTAGRQFGLAAGKSTARAGLVVGRVLDVDSRTPVAGAALWVRSCTGVSPVDIVRTNGNGEFVIRNLARGRWFIAVTRSGYLQAAPATGQEVVLGEGECVADLMLFVTRNAAITGTVTDERGAPLSDLRVALLDRGPQRHWRNAEVATTDDRGVYRFSSLRPGDYIVSVETTFYPGVPAIEAAQIISLSSGREQRGVDLRLRRVSTDRGACRTLVRGAITGRVTDEHGDPLSVTVQILTRREDTRDLSVVPAARPAQARTDDRGVYRVHGLPPGEYYVGVTHGMIGAGTAGHETTPADLQWARARIAGTAPAGPDAGLTGPDPFDQSPLTVYAPTFHPSGVTLADATPIAIEPGEERTGVDVVVGLVPGLRLAGTVVAPDGCIASSLLLALTPDRPYIPASNILGSGLSGTVWSLGGLVTPPMTSTGRFTILSLTPGTYDLVAHGTVHAPDDGTGDGSPTRMYGRASVTLGEDDVTDLVITLQPGLTLRGLASAGGGGR